MAVIKFAPLTLPTARFPVMFALEVTDRLLAVTKLPKLALMELIFPVKLPITALILPALTVPVTFALPPVVILAD